MVDFDVSRAVVLTLTGVGTAFVTLISLVILTRLMGKFLEPSSSPTEPAPETLTTPSSGATAEARSSLDDPLIAAVAASVATAQDIYSKGSASEPEGTRRTANWKRMGRWQSMTSRLGVNPRRGNRKRGG